MPDLVTNTNATTVDRVDPDTDAVLDTVDIGGTPSGIDINSAGCGYGTTPAARWCASTEDEPDRGDHPVEAGPRNVSATNTSVSVANLDADSVSRASTWSARA